ncbi:hypothetical protein AAFF_G00437580 [Aldrovandia affinis]|uniref:ADP-ribosyl cyclase/cyclic ADP-ribose hydrolase n=1 Tax=Aldrovandia affinis TaxID=143900 RepID=A0AAD7WHT6_9TELE|nr:hypothetical protein AAFF_G00437580 [Aldrovandia affinis]
MTFGPLSVQTSDMIRGLVILFFLAEDLGTEMGTTSNLKEIVIGRCYNYVTLVNPSSRYDCEEIWREFEEAVLRRAPCDVAVRDYRRMFRAAPQSLPCDRVISLSCLCLISSCYSGARLVTLCTNTLRLPRFWTLEDTLVGYMFNDLIWCGQEERNRGFDFSSCPVWSTCVNHPVYSLWKKASENFAAAACGNITVLLNGSIHNAFNKKRESCSQGSILDLIKILRSRGFRWTCTDSDMTLRILQCIQNPRQSSCQICSRSLLQRQ